MSQEFISTIVPLVLIGAIALLVGAVAGFLLAGLSNQTAPPEPKRSKSLVELARLWRDKRTGKVYLEMDGKMLQSAAEMNPDQKTSLAQAVDELQLWLSPDDLVARALGASAPAPASLPDPSPRAPAETPPPLKPAVNAAAAAALLQPAEEVKSPSLQVGDILSRAFAVDKTKNGPKTVKSIAAQVDEIVQEKLPASPFKNHLITMTDLPGAGLVVKVDDARYEGIGDVPDPEIRSFLRECVEEWERRTEALK